MLEEDAEDAAVALSRGAVEGRDAVGSRHVGVGSRIEQALAEDPIPVVCLPQERGNGTRHLIERFAHDQSHLWQDAEERRGLRAFPSEAKN